MRRLTRPLAALWAALAMIVCMSLVTFGGAPAQASNCQDLWIGVSRDVLLVS